MGDHVRGIVAGEIESAYADALRTELEGLKRHIPAPHTATLGVFHEYMTANESAVLVVVDGHPRDADKTALREVGVIAVCRFDISDDEAIVRGQARAQRFEDPHEDEAAVQRRLDRYKEGTLPVLDALALEFPFYVLDGMRPVDENVASLHEIYETHSAL
jgi:adenylate kinase family enzyme